MSRADSNLTASLHIGNRCYGDCSCSRVCSCTQCRVCKYSRVFDTPSIGYIVGIDSCTTPEVAVCFERCHLIILEYNTIWSVCHGSNHSTGVQVLGKLNLCTERNLQAVSIDVCCLKGIAYLRSRHCHMVCLDGQGILCRCRTNRTTILARSDCCAVLIPLCRATLYTCCE